ncbi:MAG: hypothetical protein IRZ10_11935 [Thermoflavifilum sp.]|nr:hypothetical protein [Thermoflavifilum sp.]
MRTMATLEGFEELTLSRADLTCWPERLLELERRLRASEIRIVDVRRRNDELTIVYRRLGAAPGEGRAGRRRESRASG